MTKKELIKLCIAAAKELREHVQPDKMCRHRGCSTCTLIRKLRKASA